MEIGRENNALSFNLDYGRSNRSRQLWWIPVNALSNLVLAIGLGRVVIFLGEGGSSLWNLVTRKDLGVGWNPYIIYLKASLLVLFVTIWQIRPLARVIAGVLCLGVIIWVWCVFFNISEASYITLRTSYILVVAVSGRILMTYIAVKSMRQKYG
jgi:hypothetical protein